MELFILNDIDYTNHTDLLRWRMKGSFTIYFDDIPEFNEFLDTLNNLRGIDNYTEATLYDLRTRTKKTSRYMFTISLVNNLPYFGKKKHEGYEIQIEEQ